MAMTDEEIREYVEVATEHSDEALAIIAVSVPDGPTGDVVSDIRAIAEEYEMNVEVVLYVLFDAESPLHTGEMP